MNIFELAAKLALDSSDYIKGINEAEKATSSSNDKITDSVKKTTDNYNQGLKVAESSSNNFGQALKKGIVVAAGLTTAALTAITAAAAAGTKAFINAAKATAEMGDDIDDNSQKVGFSAKSWQEWDYVLNLAGSDMKSATMGIKTLTNQVDAAKKGNKDAIANFKALGISVKSLKNMSREEIFEKVISQLQKMPESSKRAALANKVLGRSGQELSALFNMSNEETQKAIKTANEYGMVLDDRAVKASSNFQDSLTTLQGAMTGLKNNMMSNFLPSLTTVMDGLSKVFSGSDTENGMKTIEVGIMSLVDKLTAEMPRFLELGKTIFMSVIQGFAPMLPSLVSTIFDIGVQAITTVSSMLPTMMPIIITGIQNSLSALLSALPVIFEGLSQLVLGIVNWLAEPANVQLVVNSIVSVCTQIVNSIGMILPVLLPAIVTIIGEVAKALTQPDNVQMLLDAVLTVVGAIIVALINSVPVLLDAVKGIFSNLGELISRLLEFLVPIAADGIEAIVNTVKSWGNAVKTFVLNLINGIRTSISNWINNLKQGFLDGFNAIKNSVSSILSGIGDFVKSVIDKIKELPSKALSIGKDLITGLWNGISNKISWVKDKIKGMGESITKAIKGVFGIHSPSKVFAQVGSFLAEGLGIGYEKEMKNVQKDILGISEGLTDSIMANTPTSATTGVAGVRTSSGTVVNATFNITGAEGQDIRELAKVITEEIQNLINDKEKVYA